MGKYMRNESLEVPRKLHGVLPNYTELIPEADTGLNNSILELLRKNGS